MGYQYPEKVEQGIKILQRAKELNPKSIATLQLLGIQYSEAKRWEEARESFLNGLKIDPEDYQLNKCLINTLIELKTPIETILPYIKIALRNTHKQRINFPRWGRFIKWKNFDGQEFHKKCEEIDREWIDWAKSILSQYEKGN